MTKALVVEDDPEVMEIIEDTLYSMGHDHQWVTNQHDARRAIHDDHFQYVLLDLQIPAKPNRGGASVDFGVNLLRDIHELAHFDDVPVVIMTANSADCLDLSTTLTAMGASEFISKPFHNRDRSLAKVIRKVVRRRSSKSANSIASNIPIRSQTFSGGELVFHPGHVELLGVTIITDQGSGQSMKLLTCLAERDSAGCFLQLSAEELADAIGATHVGVITGCVKTLRDNVVKRLGNVGVNVGRDDVIQHDQSGYSLRAWISVGSGNTLECPSNVPADAPAAVPADADLNQRQRWILEQLRCGVALQRVMVERQYNVGEKTAKRDLAILVRDGRITFVRQGRSGHYQLL